MTLEDLFLSYLAVSVVQIGKKINIRKGKVRKKEVKPRKKGAGGQTEKTQK